MITILQTAFLGDTLLTIPLAKALRAEGHELTLVCRQGLGSFLSTLGLFKSVIEIEKGRSASYAAARRQLGKTELLISPHLSTRSKIFALGLRLGGVQTIGYSGDVFSLLAYSKSRPRPMQLPEALRQLALLEINSGLWNAALWASRINEFTAQQGAAGGLTQGGQLMPVPEWASMQLELFPGQLRRQTVVLAPGSVWATKRWTQDGFAEVGAKMLERGYAVELVGTRDEREICDSVAARIRRLTTVGFIGNRAGEIDLLQTARVIAEASFAVANDSGAMHLAAVVGTPVIGVFGPTVLDFGYRPWAINANTVVVQPKAKLSCRPCGKHGARECPLGTHECMIGISASAVLEHLVD